MFSCCLLLSICCCHAHFSSPSVGTASIGPVDHGAVSVTLLDRRSRSGSAPLAECVFEYSTDPSNTAAAAPSTTEQPSARVAPNSLPASLVLQRLENQCVTSTSAFWSYELCFGKYLKQFHGNDNYVLSRSDGAGGAGTMASDGHSVLVKGGDMCAALSPPAEREVRISFGCKANAVNPQLVSIQESSTCHYDVSIALSTVCADPSYPLISQMPTAPVATPSTTPGLEGEDWFVELIELPVTGDGAEDARPVLMCQAYTLEYRSASGTPLKFANFKLKINQLSGDPNRDHRKSADDLPVEYRTPLARKLARTPLPAGSFDVEYASISMAPDAAEVGYDGTLSFIKVYA